MTKVLKSNHVFANPCSGNFETVNECMMFRKHRRYIAFEIDAMGFKVPFPRAVERLQGPLLTDISILTKILGMLRVRQSFVTAVDVQMGGRYRLYRQAFAGLSLKQKRPKFSLHFSYNRFQDTALHEIGKPLTT